MIFARSPFIVPIAESGQEGSKLKLKIYNGTSVPSGFVYELDKLIPASNNVNTYYNISPYIREFISFDTCQTFHATRQSAPTSQYCTVYYEKYKLDGGVYTQVGTDSQKCFDGYGYYEDGSNPDMQYPILHNQGTFYYAYNSDIDPSTNADYRAGFITVSMSIAIKVRWTNLTTNATQEITIGANVIDNISRVHPSYYASGNKLEIMTMANVVLWTSTFKPYLNCRYTPVVCDFVNRFGSWQRIWFFGASNDTLSVEKKDYNLMQKTFPNYNTQLGQRRTFNANGKKSIKVNTDWVSEGFKEIIQQLMLSERILINNLPAKLNTQSTELFKSINTKMINYQMEFEFSFDAINSVI